MALVLALTAFPAAATGLATTVRSAASVGASSAATPSTRALPTVPAQLVDANGQPASSEVMHVARWVAHSGDNGGMPYLIIDKVNATVFVFDAGGAVKGAEPALLGIVKGDTSAEGIGDQKLAAIRPQDRTTPAGRFVASLDRDLRGDEILWIDYDSALALHRVAKGQPSERRAQRLQSPAADDNRISFGCINVPVNFYEQVVSPVFTGTAGIVYILPEMGTARDMFGSYEVDGDVDVHVRSPAQQ